MNLILHNCPTAVVMQGNTLANPLFKEGDRLKTFDYVVANPPFSDKRWSNGIDPLNDPYDRFAPFGVPPGKQGEHTAIWRRWMALSDRQTELKQQMKDAETELDALAYAKYPELPVDEIKGLVVDDK